MNKTTRTYLSRQDGLTALIITFAVLALSLVLTVSVAFVYLNRLEASRHVGMAEQAYFAAEAGAEDALLRILGPDKTEPASYPYMISVGNSTVEVVKTTDVFGRTVIDARGDRANRMRLVQVVLALDTAVGSVAYGAHIGEDGLIMESNSTVDGNVFSNGNITGQSNTRIMGDAIAVGSISSPNPAIDGSKTTGADPIPLPAINVAAWKDAANINNDPIIGSLILNSGSTQLGPRRIDGDLILDSNAEVVITGPLHVTGNIVLNSNSGMKLANTFGSQGTVVLASGAIQFKSNAGVDATNSSPKGYPMLVSEAIGTETVLLDSNSLIEGVLYALNGELVINSNGKATAIIGKSIRLKSNALVDYDLGLASQQFSAGDGASYAIIDWKEQ